MVTIPTSRRLPSATAAMRNIITEKLVPGLNLVTFEPASRHLRIGTRHGVAVLLLLFWRRQCLRGRRQDFHRGLANWLTRSRPEPFIHSPEGLDFGPQLINQLGLFVLM